jgi:hypothetical protein
MVRLVAIETTVSWYVAMNSTYSKTYMYDNHLERVNKKSQRSWYIPGTWWLLAVADRQ